LEYITAGVQRAELGEESAAVVAGQLCVQRVDRDVDGPAVSLELEDVL